jgi:solute carrier family 25 (mitochondrial phosphate transporter), member 23/24/25/41
MDSDAITDLWKSLDPDVNGRISQEKLRAGLRQHGVPFTAAGLRRVMQLFDSDSDGKLTFNEFAAYIQFQQQHLLEAFQDMDLEHRGSISARDIERFATRMNVKLSHAEIACLISTIDRDKCGSIDQEEFVRYFLTLTGDLHAEGVFEAWLKESAIGSIPLSDPEGRAKTESWVLLSSGAVAGMLSRTLTAPMDRLKTLVQASSSAAEKRVSVTCDSSASIRANGILQGVRAILNDGGVRAFWRGNGVNVIKVAPETASRFWAYERVKQLICLDPDNISVFERFASGATAGVFAQAVIYPLEIAKTRFCLSPTGHYRGLSHCLTSIVRNEGPTRLYRGLVASLLGIVPYSGTDLTVFSMLKVRL